MLYSPVKVNEIVLNLHARKVATVGVGFPATNMTEERTREGPNSKGQIILALFHFFLSGMMA